MLNGVPLTSIFSITTQLQTSTSTSKKINRHQIPLFSQKSSSSSASTFQLLFLLPMPPIPYLFGHRVNVLRHVMQSSEKKNFVVLSSLKRLPQRPWVPPVPPELMNLGVSGATRVIHRIQYDSWVPSHPVNHRLIIYGCYRSEKGRKRFTSSRIRLTLAELWYEGGMELGLCGDFTFETWSESLGGVLLGTLDQDCRCHNSRDKWNFFLYCWDVLQFEVFVELF